MEWNEIKLGTDDIHDLWKWMENKITCFSSLKEKQNIRGYSGLRYDLDMFSSNAFVMWSMLDIKVMNDDEHHELLWRLFHRFNIISFSTTFAKSWVRNEKLNPHIIGINSWDEIFSLLPTIRKMVDNLNEFRSKWKWFGCQNIIQYSESEFRL